MKALKPSARERKRYLLIKGENLKENIEKTIFDFIGILGASKAGLKYIKITSKTAVISINRKGLDLVRASFAISKENLKIEKVSGTLKSLKKSTKIFKK